MPQINVPGIGEVFADGFAEEQTMQRILSVLSSADNVNSADAQRDLADKSKEASSGILGLGRAVDKAGDQTRQGGQTFAAGLNSATSASAIFSRDLRRSASALSMSFSDLQAKPFALAQTMTEVIGKLAQNNRVFSSLVGALGGTAIADMLGADGPIAKSLAGAGGAIAGFLSTATVPMMAAIAGFLFEKLNATSTAFMSVQKSGALLGGSFIEFRNFAHNANLTMGEFNNIFQKNSEAMATFGGQTERGAREFARANMAVNNLAGRELRALGFNFEDIGNVTAEVLQNFGEAGVAIDRTAIGTRAFAETVADAARQTKIMATLTGRSIDQQKEQERAQRRDAQVQATIARLGPQQQKNIRDLITAFPQMRDLILDQVTFGSATSKNALMMANAMPETTRAFAETVDGIKDGSLQAVDSFVKMAKSGDLARGELLNNADMTILSRFSNNEFLKTIEGSFLNLQQLTTAAINNTVRDVGADLEKAQSGMNAATNALLNLQDANRKLGMSLSKLTTNMLKNSDGIVEFVATGTNAITAGIQKLNRVAGIDSRSNVGPYNTEIGAQIREVAETNNQIMSPGAMGGVANTSNTSSSLTNTGNPIIDARNKQFLDKLDELIAATKRSGSGIMDTISKYF